jgi:hypothetical protein
MNQSTIRLENLSNEFFYEIFDYFDGCEIYHSFSNLNHRFQQLINSSSLLLKIHFGYSQSTEIFMDNYQQILCLHKNQILSIHLWTSTNVNQITSSFIFDSLFNCLESLIISSVETDVLISLLLKLTCLPRLFSLIIDTWPSHRDLTEIYRLIFNLPQLKYLKYTVTESNDFDIIISLPIATNTQISSIEHLNIDHGCAIDELFAMISYTPHLRRLKFLTLTNKIVNIEALQPVVLPNLTHLSVHIYDKMSFNKFEMLIRKLNLKLKVLSLTSTFEDIAYLDANRWEELISKNLPQLDEFYFKYSAYFNENYDTPMYVGKRDQFISSFWLQRRWILGVEADFENLIYSIRPYKYRKNKFLN